ncbi:MAG: hypothetical protein ACRDVN_08580 [Jiangellaceae bacterium]
MSSIVAPAIEAEVDYRRERVTEDFRRARNGRRSRTGRARTDVRRSRPSVSAHHA